MNTPPPLGAPVEEQLRRLNRVHTALTLINQTIVRTPTREELLHRICRIFVEQAGFRMAWIGWHDPASQRILPVASRGDRDGYLDSIQIYGDDRPEGRGPTGIAFRLGRPYICNDIVGDPALGPWRPQIDRRGFRSSAAFPIRVRDEVRGVLTVYAPEPEFFQDKEMALLEQVSADTTFALENMLLAAEHRAAVEEIRQMNAELERRVGERTAQLEAANRELEAFSYSVSHDLRAPLRAINGFAGILVEDFATELPPEARAYLDRIRQGGQRMGELIDDLLAFSRVTKQVMRHEQVDMTALVQQVIDVLKYQDEGHCIEVHVDPLPPADGDPALIKQVWQNLLSNAFKYTRHRDPAVIDVRSQGGDDGETVYLVRDNGVGFDMHYAHKLFGVFQRLHRDEEFEGTGVGLAIVQRIITRHGGRIWVDAAPGRGATFFFTLGRGTRA